MRSYQRFLCVFAALLAVTTGWGQTTSAGAVNVTVLDQLGATVPGAELALKDLATNDVRRGQTQVNGTYSFPNLPFGTYELRVTAAGFESQVFESVLVQTGRVTSVIANLKVGTTTQSVTVTEAATPLVETESSTLATTVDTKQASGQPADGQPERDEPGVPGAGLGQH